MIDSEAQILLQTVFDKLAEHHIQLKIQPKASPSIYDNKSLVSLFGVKDRYLKLLRTTAPLATPDTATNTGTSKLARCHFAPFDQ